MLPLVAIVGRPNVGKSTLFNKLVRSRSALVADEPGMTRDRHYGRVTVGDRPFDLVDTGGLELDAAPEARPLEAQITEQSKVAIDEADVIVAVWDARDGLTAADEEIIALLRRSPKPVLHVVNKVDGPKQDLLANEFFKLGIESLHRVSAAHGLGLDDLLDAIEAALPGEPDPADAERAKDDDTLRVALVGRPNAGKSALLNQLVGTPRSIVSDVPGTTRDPVNAEILTDEGRVVIVDTAGIRRRRRSSPAMEQLAVLFARRAIVDADVACLVVDAHAGVTVQDAKIVNAVLDAGRALLIAFNKSDLLGSQRQGRRAAAEQAAETLSFADFVPHVLISAKEGAGIGRVLPGVRRVYASWKRRVPTAQLNRFFEEAAMDHPPPAYRGRAVRFYYAQQPQAAPPTIIVTTNYPLGVPDSYKRYIHNRLRERFGFEGSPIRLFFRARSRKGSARPSRGR